MMEMAAVDDLVRAMVDSPPTREERELGRLQATEEFFGCFIFFIASCFGFSFLNTTETYLDEQGREEDWVDLFFDINRWIRAQQLPLG